MDLKHSPQLMNSYADNAVNQLREKEKFPSYSPEIMLVLGSGCGDVAKAIKADFKEPYSKIHRMPVSTVKGHDGNLILGEYKGKKVVAFQGRNHYYEGNSAQEASYMVHIAKHLGAKVGLFTAAAGLAPSFNGPKRYAAEVGDITLMASYNPNLLPSSLIGSIPPGTERFPGTINVPSLVLKTIAKKVAQTLDLNLGELVYVPRQGPCYETPAEVDLLTHASGIWGMPAAGGMSTVPELEAANFLGMDTLAFVVVTNQCFGMKDQRELEKRLKDQIDCLTLTEANAILGELISEYQPSHEDVAKIANAKDVTNNLEQLIGGVVEAVRF
jgi:purine-nucleoside phosphorylase